MTTPDDMNKPIIAEFRANGGKVGSWLKGAPVVLVTTKGAKSGTPVTFPLVYLPDGDKVVIFASKGGAPKNPGWYYNLIKAGTASIEVGTDKYDVDVAEVKGPERDALYARQVTAFAGFGEYEEKTKGIRVIPVLSLTRKA